MSQHVEFFPNVILLNIMRQQCVRYIIASVFTFLICKVKCHQSMVTALIIVSYHLGRLGITGLARLIQSLSSARFCFKLSENLN